MACSLISLWVTGVSILMHAGSLFAAHILMLLACLRPVLSSVCRGPYWVLIPPQELAHHAQIVRETWGDPPVSFVPVELLLLPNFVCVHACTCVCVRVGGCAPGRDAHVAQGATSGRTHLLCNGRCICRCLMSTFGGVCM